MARPKIIDPVLSREFHEFSRALDLYLKRTEGDVGSLVRKQARLFGVDLVMKTNPFGKSKKALAKGEGAIGTDVARVFASQGKIHQEIRKQSEEAADAFYYLIKQGKFDEAQKIVNNMGGSFSGVRIDGVSPEVHQGSRSMGGRVRRPRPALITRDSGELEEYRKEVKGRTFWAKASWAVDLHKLGGARGIPATIMRHRASPGMVEDLTRATSPRKQVNFISRVPYISSLISYSSVRRALGFRARVMLQDLGIIARKHYRRKI